MWEIGYNIGYNITINLESDQNKKLKKNFIFKITKILQPTSTNNYKLFSPIISAHYIEI